MSQTKPKIALIEDDVPIVQMYLSKFETEGFDVKSAGDGDSGLELIKEFRPDVILMDLMMPHTTGLQLMQSIRNLSVTAKTKIIVLTNMGNDEVAEQVKKLGADDYLIKSDLTPSQVAERVKQVMNN
ncbi:MAG TPA: response regulator [Candidatus Nanoarchaeia archaeon]|nr:response regulator [Candidatus Nanoarchaeia archaeon]